MSESFFLTTVYLVGLAVAAWHTPIQDIVGSTRGPGSLTVTSFNTAGVADTWNESRVAWYHSLFTAGDVVAMQEVRGSREAFTQHVKSALPANHTVFVSEAMGRTQYYKERYVFVVNNSSVTVRDAFVLDGVNATVNRPPYALNISHRNQSFVIVNAHTDPERANIEMRAFTSSLSRVRTPVIVAGDLNADCAYGSTKGINDAFTAFISADADTTTSSTDCAYDRVLGDDDVAARHRTDRVGDAPEWVSDHRPVRASFASAS